MERRHTEPSDQQGLPVHSSRSNDSSRDYPSLHQNGSGHTMGSQQSINNRISPTTPRSTQVNVSVLRSLGEPYSFSESPIDFREPSGFRHSMFNSVHSKHGLKDHQIEPFSEQADIDELNSEDSEMDKYDGRESTYVKRQKMESEETDISLYGNMLPNLKRIHERNVEAFKNIKVDDEGEEMNAGDLQAVSSKRKQDGPRGVLREVLTTKGKKATKAPLQKRGLVPTLSLGENMDQTEDEVPVGAGNARGLRDYAQRVCKHVQEKGLTTHTELVRELCNSNAGGNASETSAHDKIGRRIYDALNVLEATGIITNDSKNIGWIGIEEAMVVKGITMVHPTHFVSNGLSGGGRDDESEEPEEDDMDIEQFEREIIAMRQRNEQEQAKLRDQLTRQVQLAGLVKRNKQNEAKKEERRRQRKEEKRRLRAIEDSSMADVKPHCSSDQNDEARPTSERHRRRRSPRHVSERTDGQTSGAGMDESDLVENEEARMRRKKESKERRERRAQRKLEKEKNRIHWPCVIVRMSGYTGQNSDSESNISVKRSIQIPSQSDENVESTDQETTIVDIAIQQQEELVIMSDSEILGDLGFNTLTIDELEDILPKEYIDAVQFTVNTEERVPSSEDDSDMAIENGARATTITVQGGFEREFVRGVSF
ncbi:Transcription factor Dp-2 [Haplosporangium sp. Z 27]|nr:Transcription factor Dp-2 [Haplosporangium sp. Z 27]